MQSAPPAPRRAAPVGWARRVAALLAAAAAGGLAACASAPPPAAPGAVVSAPPITWPPATSMERDGPPAQPPAGLDQVPDATPRVEPLRVGGPNKPYEVLGVAYAPMSSDSPLRETGLASWYGRKFHGRPTANGETYDMYAMTAAHKTMPLPSYARVRNPANGREVVVRVNDRGPFHSGRIIDLSYTAALRLGVLGGVARVEVERLTHDDIRAGQAPASATPAARLPPGVPQAPADWPEAAADGAAPAPGFWLQLGAFRDRQGADQLQRLLQREAPWLAARLAVFEDPTWARVQAGPFDSRDQAQAAAARLADALPLQALVLQRR